MREATLHRGDSLHVWATRSDDGELVIQGLEPCPGPSATEECEYAITVHVEDVPTVVAALGGDADADVLDLLAADGGQIVTVGEATWLESLGVKPTFWSWMD
jgi:hypothetical protein